MSLIAPAYVHTPDAADFEAELAKRLVWTEEQFGGDYAWSVPPRERWNAEIAALNERLDQQSK